MDIDGNQ
jgi:hypothetical protein